MIIDKVRGSLIGGAVGDALGYAVEFFGYRQIVNRYGPGGITRCDLGGNGVAEISDDTQMTLFTAAGLLNCWDDYARRGVMRWPLEYVREAYLEWYVTQTGRPGDIKAPKCEISNMPELYSLRAPGNTCMSALRAMANGQEPCNNSKGCGGIMRVAPMGLSGAARGKDIEAMTQIACEAARLTHLHPLGYLPAGMLAYVVQRMAQTERPSKADLILAVHEGLRVLEKLYPEPGIGAMHAELARGTNAVIMLADTGEEDVKAITSLGEGWTGEEAWYIALYCALKHFGDFERAVVAAVNHNGDSDSTGAICGNLVGAIVGLNAIPKHFLCNLELFNLLLLTADRLAE